MPTTRSQTKLQEIHPPENFIELWDESNRQTSTPLNHFYLNEGRVIGKVSSSIRLEAELAWMLYFRSLADPSRVIIPQPIGTVISNNDHSCLYMHTIPGQTLKQWIESNGPLTSKLADAVTDAFIALREAADPSSHTHDYLVPGGLPWEVRGHVFDEDNEAGCIFTTRTEFNTMMTSRFHIAVGPHATFSVSKPAFAHGDISPKNIILTDDGRVAVLDFGYSAWLPHWWDAYLLSRGLYRRTQGFGGPLREAFKRRGIWMDELDHTSLLMTFFSDWGKSQKGRWYLRDLRKQRGLMEKQEEDSAQIFEAEK